MDTTGDYLPTGSIVTPDEPIYYFDQTVNPVEEIRDLTRQLQKAIEDAPTEFEKYTAFQMYASDRMKIQKINGLLQKTNNDIRQSQEIRQQIFEQIQNINCLLGKKKLRSGKKRLRDGSLFDNPQEQLDILTGKLHDVNLRLELLQIDQQKYTKQRRQLMHLMEIRHPALRSISERNILPRRLELKRTEMIVIRNFQRLSDMEIMEFYKLKDSLGSMDSYIGSVTDELIEQCAADPKSSSST